MNLVNVGIIGYGLSGRIFHGAIINAVIGFKISKVVTRDATKKEEALSDHPGVEVVDSTDELFKDEAIDLVVINTPSTLHAE